jgi:hypothetical protein
MSHETPREVKSVDNRGVRDAERHISLREPSRHFAFMLEVKPLAGDFIVKQRRIAKLKEQKSSC